jgi:hypothetical protein
VIRAALAMVAVLALAGCASTQSTSARLKAEAVNRPLAKAFVVTEPYPDVKVTAHTLLSGDGGATAVVFELRSRARKPQARVPLSFELLDGKGARVYRNDAPGLDASLVEAPVVPSKGALVWVDDQIQPTGRPRRARATVGLPRVRPDGEPPRIRVSRVRVEQDPVSGSVVKGIVSNASPIEQKRLVVFVVARRGGRIVGAGRAIVPRLKAHDHATFTSFLIGDAEHARLSATAPPTTLTEPAA